MTEIMMSIKPVWLFKELNGEKVLEVRRTAPKPFEGTMKVWLYCTMEKPYLYKHDAGGYYVSYTKKEGALNGKVVGYVLLDSTNIYKLKADTLEDPELPDYIEKYACIPFEDFKKYVGGKDYYIYEFGNRMITHLPKPKLIRDFDSPNGFTLCEKCKWFSDKRLCSGKHCNSLYKAPQSWYYCEEWEDIRKCLR